MPPFYCDQNTSDSASFAYPQATSDRQRLVFTALSSFGLKLHCNGSIRAIFGKPMTNLLCLKSYDMAIIFMN